MDLTNEMVITYYINVYISSPDLVILINGPRVSYFSSSSINLDASASYDPISTLLPITYQWDCPTYFGGEGCSS
jgi:hypothetical protein